MPRAERARQMIEVAGGVFAERGYTAVSMHDIAERVGITKPMLYAYFRSKEGLLVACIAHVRGELRDATERAVRGASSPEQALHRGLLAFFVFAKERRCVWSLLRYEGTLIGTSAWKEIEETRRQQTDLIAELIADYFAPTQPLSDVAASAEFVAGACERLAIWSEQHDDMTPERATDVALNVLGYGLRARTS